MDEHNGKWDTENTPKSSTLGYGILAFCLMIALILVFLPTNKASVNVVEKTTELRVRNVYPDDSVLVYLTLNGSDGFVNDVNGIFGIKSEDKLQGSFYLEPHETVSYTSPTGKGISGNISFLNPPQNCPYRGTTLYEFTLNNEGTVENAQETVDISCVAGVSTYGLISMVNGGEWTDNINPKQIVKIENGNLYTNTGISGVYPYGCTTCISTKGTPECQEHPDYAKPNKNNICNVQRNAKNNGGYILIAYIGKVD